VTQTVNSNAAITGNALSIVFEQFKPRTAALPQSNSYKRTSQTPSNCAQLSLRTTNDDHRDPGREGGRDAELLVEDQIALYAKYCVRVGL